MYSIIISIKHTQNNQNFQFSHSNLLKTKIVKLKFRRNFKTKKKVLDTGNCFHANSMIAIRLQLKKKAHFQAGKVFGLEICDTRHSIVSQVLTLFNLAYPYDLTSIDVSFAPVSLNLETASSNTPLHQKPVVETNTAILLAAVLRTSFLSYIKWRFCNSRSQNKLC